MFNENTYQVIEEIRRKIADVYTQMSAVTVKSDHMITIETIEQLEKQISNMTPLYRIEEVERDMLLLVT